MTELVVVLFLVLLNGFFAMSEMAVVTARKSRLKELARDSRGAKAAYELALRPEHFLSTVQVGITLIGVLTGVFGGEAIGANIAEGIRTYVTLLAPWADPVGLGVAVAMITFLSLILGELVPKRFALTRAESIAAAVSLPMRGLALIAAPAVLLLSVCTRLTLRALRIRQDTAQRVSEEEIRLMVAESHEQGVIDTDERNMMNRVLRLGDRTVASLMTPRIRIVWLNAALADEDNLRIIRESPCSRYPVCRGSDAEVLGIFETKRLAARLDAKKLDLTRELRRAVFVPESAKVTSLLDSFRVDGAVIALVVDEYGDIQGMVTVNDLLGAVLGRAAAIDTAASSREAPVVKRADGSLLVDGTLPSEDLLELLGVPSLPGAAAGDFNTLAGFVMAHFNRIPRAGEHFDWQGWRFEVIDLDGARIDKLLLLKHPEPELRDGAAS